MSDELLRLLEVGIAGIVVAAATYVLGMFRLELMGVVFSLTTLAGQSVIAFLEQLAAAPIPGRIDPPA